MKGERQLSVDGTLANANIRGGGGDGISTRNKIGLNYKNEFSKKLSADVGYNFENFKNNTISSSYTQSFLQDSLMNAVTRIEDANSNIVTDNFRHWMGGNLEYKLDSNNYLKISPNLSFDQNSAANSTNSITKQETLLTTRIGSQQSNVDNLNVRTSLFYNHKFAKPGRSVTGWGSIAYVNDLNDKDVINQYLNGTAGQLDSVNQNQTNLQQSGNTQINLGLSYMEPLSKSNYI